MTLLLQAILLAEGSPFKPDVTAKPDARNSFGLRRPSAGVISNPRFRDSPPNCKLRGIDQFQGVPASLGHQWDICCFKIHVFTRLAVYRGYPNRCAKLTFPTPVRLLALTSTNIPVP